MRSRSARLLAGSLLSAVVFFASSVSAARPVKHKSASSKDADTSSGDSSTSSNSATEGASSAATVGDSPMGESPLTATDKPVSPQEASDAAAVKDKANDAGAAETTDATAEPVASEEPPVISEPQPAYVDHLGPSTYPGKLRGIYGGSMWLEPSFNGLQWPYMRRSGVGVSGSIWVDSGYEKIIRDAPVSPDTTMILQQARAVLRVTPTYAAGDFFIQGQVELVGNQCQTTSQVCTTAGTFDTDDLWLRFGQWNKWDLKVGRFEAWELYHTGMGLDINTLERQGAKRDSVPMPDSDLDAPDYYGVNYMHDRPSEGLGVGYVAFHGYPSSVFRVELLGELGTDSVNTTTGKNYFGGRPAAILDLGWLKLKAGAEYERRTVGTQSIVAGSKVESPYRGTRKGFGGSVAFVIDPVLEFGGGAAYGSQSDSDVTTGVARPLGTFTTTTVGGFLNVRLSPLWMFGGGVHFTWQNDSFYANGSSDADYTAHLQAFGAIQYLLSRQLFIKAVFGYARADFLPSDPLIDLWSNYMYSGRVRLMYLY